MQAKGSRWAAATAVFLLSACGGSGGSGAGLAGDGTPGSGYLIGPRVEGLSHGAGLTGVGGEFNQPAGSVLNFRLGDLALADVRQRPRLSLYDLAGAAEQYRHNKGVRLGQLLLSLDTDADPRNGVQLGAAAASAGELDWQASDSLWQAAAASLVYRLSDGARTLVSASAARDTITAQLRAEGEDCRSGLGSTRNFAIADPRCADRQRMALWRESYAPALQALQRDLDDYLDQRLTTQAWWQQLLDEQGALLALGDSAIVWTSYALAGADVPLRDALQAALAAGALSDELQHELERWRAGGGRAMRARDAGERTLAEQTVDAWLEYGFDRPAFDAALGLAPDSGWEAPLRAVAAREGTSTAALRLAVVDQQVYLALRALDQQMQGLEDWVTGGAAAGDNGGGGDDGGLSGDDPARVWRVAYGALETGREVEFTVEGSALDDQVQLVLAGCSQLQALSGSASQRVYRCELGGDAGGRVLQVLDGADGSLLYEAVVRVEQGADDGGDPDPVVTGVSPAKAERGSTQRFDVSGRHLPLDLRFSLAGCSGQRVLSRSSTRVEVECTLDDRATVRSGSIALADGTEIFQFNVAPVLIDEPEIRLTEIAPAAALEGETLEFTLTGSGIGDTARAQTSACGRVETLSRTDAELRFRCVDAVLGTWPVYLVSAQQTVLAPRSVQVRAVEAQVQRVTPLQATEGEWFNLQVSGTQLGDGVRVELGACPELELLDSTAVLRQFGCTPQTPGRHRGQVLVGEQVLYTFDFSVEASTTGRVDSVSPQSSPHNQPLELEFRGEELSDQASLELESCQGIALLDASDTRLRFSCTPQSVGEIEGRLLDGDGKLLLAFRVDIVEGEDPLDAVVITAVEPGSTYLDLETTFTVRGEALPSSLVLQVQDCTAVQAMGGHAGERQFRCTPRGSSGLRQMSVYAREGGALLGEYELRVIGKEMRVSAVSPARSAVGVNTIFRVTGQNLNSSMVLDLEGCDARLLGSSSTEHRAYRCVPYGLPGTRVLQIRDRVGGSVLYSGTIEMLPRP